MHHSREKRQATSLCSHQTKHIIVYKLKNNDRNAANLQAIPMYTSGIEGCVGSMRNVRTLLIVLNYRAQPTACDSDSSSSSHGGGIVLTVVAHVMMSDAR